MSSTVCTAYPHSLYSSCNCPTHRARRLRVMKLASAGLLVKVPATAAWEAIDRMHARGYSTPQIAEAAQYNPRSLQGAHEERRRGHARRFGPLIAKAIVQAEIVLYETAEPHRTPVCGPQRRLRALAAMGWNGDAISADSGVPVASLQKIRTGTWAWVNSATAKAIAESYDRLWHQQGGDHRSLGKARVQGWPGPLAWDDTPPEDPEEVSHWIDDPDAVPDLGTAAGQRKIDMVLLLQEIERGTTDTRMAEWFGCDRESLYQALRRKGHEEAADRLLAWSGRSPLVGARRASRAS